jgi:hypothetical protein
MYHEEKNLKKRWPSSFTKMEKLTSTVFIKPKAWWP